MPGFHMCVLAQSLSLCDPMDCSPPGFSVHGLSQARILECVAISSFRGSSLPRDWTCISWVSCTGGRILYHWATWGAWFAHTHTHTCTLKASGNNCWLDFTFLRISGVTGGSCHLIFPLFSSIPLPSLLYFLYLLLSVSKGWGKKEGEKKSPF